MDPFTMIGITGGTIEIAKFTGKELAKYILKKEVFDKLFSENTLCNELTRVINETITDFSKSNPAKNTNGFYSFYQSQIIMTELLKFRIMHKEDYDIESLYIAFEKETNIIYPTKEELNKFFELFIDKITKDETLKKIEISKTFQEEIFLISKKLDFLQRSLENLINSIGADLELQWKDRIEAYKFSLNQFNPETALRLLTTLEDSFSISTKKPSDEFIALIEYQKGLCYNFMFNEQESSKAFIKAYNKSSTNKTYKEQASITYYKLKEFDKSLTLSNEILEVDEFNSFAHATKLLNADVNTFEDTLNRIPQQVVKDDLLFKRLVYNRLLNEKKSSEIDILEESSFFPKINEYKEQKISINTYSEIVFWINFTISKYFKTYYFNFLESNKSNLEIITFLNKLLSEFITSIKHSEIEKDSYRLYFFLSYTNFILTGENKHTLSMYEFYEKGKFKNLIFSLLCANSLQLAGYATEALDLLNKIPEKDDETALFLKQFIYLKQNDIANYIFTSKESIKSVSLISDRNIGNYLNTLFTLYNIDKLDTFTVDEFTDKKQYTNESYKELVETIAKLLINGKDDDLVNRLNQISKILAEDNAIDFAAITLYFIQEYEHAITVFRMFLDFEKESKELFYYINCLENAKIHNTELLVLLEKWRTKFSFNDYFLRLEANKRRQLLEWEKCVEICNFYLNGNPNDESFIVLLIQSYNQINDQESQLGINNLSKKVVSIDYIYLPHVSIVSEVLIRHKYHKEALELLYRYAKKPENSQLRMSYFLACSKTYSEENPIAKEYEVIEKGYFIKYLLDSKVHFVELNDNNISKFNDFIGHKKGAIVSIKRPLIDIVDNITILRIMDKYLSLHDEIMEEVHNNPYSGIPMTSFRFEGDDVESLNKTFQNFFGEQGSKIEEQNTNLLSKYYNYSLSFTEVILNSFRNEYSGGYYHLVHQNNGINVLPLLTYGSVNTSKKEFVLDFSSLLIFHQISRHHNITYPNKFIISTYIVENIKNQLQNIETEHDSEMSLSITKEKVIPTFKEEGTTQNNKTFLNNLLKWIKDNCIVKLSPKILDFTAKLDSDISKKPFIDYVLNNILLAEEENKILITDDTVYFKNNLLNINKTCSTEYYFSTIFGSEHKGFYEFIRNKYRGITLTQGILLSEFEKKNTSQLNFYSNCLENLSPFRNPNNGVVAIGFIKSILLNLHLPNETKSIEIIEVFFNLLKGWTNADIIKEIRNLLVMECNLINIDPDFLLKCFDDSIKLLGS